jgi:NarL family two-component system response regulator LiaR
VITVVLVDDHAVVTEGLRRFLESFPDIRVVGTARSGEELLERLASWQPRVLVLDLLMPGGIDGIETTRRALQASPEMRIVALTASTDEARMNAALRAGASGYVRKDAEPELLLKAIRALAGGRTFIDPAAAGAAGSPAVPTDDLSPREIDVLREIAFGRTNKDVAQRLFITEETVKTHVARILSKLGLQNRTQLVAYAVKRGLVDVDEL